MLESWTARATKDRDVPRICTLRAHLGYLFKNVSAEELTQRSVTTLLSSQMFLNGNYRYDADVSNGVRDPSRSRNQADQFVDSSLAIPQTELFDLFQQHRCKILHWLTSHPLECNAVMETVLRILTYTDTATDELQLGSRQWHGTTLGGVGCFVPDTEAKGSPLARRDSEPEAEPAESYAKKLVNSLTQKMEAVGGGESYEAWLRRTTTQEIETEINIQLGEFTLKKRQVGHRHALPLRSRCRSARDTDAFACGAGSWNCSRTRLGCR